MLGDEGPRENQQFKRLDEHVYDDPNVQQQFSGLLRILRRTSKDRLMETNASSDWGTTGASEQKRAKHESFPDHKKARGDKNDKVWIHSRNEILRWRWRRFLP